jgi:hypothetical protein
MLLLSANKVSLAVLRSLLQHIFLAVPYYYFHCHVFSCRGHSIDVYLPAVAYACKKVESFGINVSGLCPVKLQYIKSISSSSMYLTIPHKKSFYCYLFIPHDYVFTKSLRRSSLLSTHLRSPLANHLPLTLQPQVQHPNDRSPNLQA